MINEYLKKILIFVLLLSLLIGIAYATDDTNSTKSFKKQDTKLTLKPIKNTTYTKNTTISGEYETSNGKKLKNTTLRININNKNYTTKTNIDGKYSFNYKANTPGQNNITITYPGNNKYNGTNIKSSFYVESKNTYIKLNKIEDAYYKSYININGYYKDSDNKALKNTRLTISINYNKYYVKTDKQGYFNLKYKTTEIKEHNVTISYIGNPKYKKAYNVTKFNVKPNPTKIILNPIKTTTYKKNMTLMGKYVDNNNKALQNTILKINFNGKYYTTKTDKQGNFKRNIRANTAGLQNVTIQYPGNTKYLPAKSSATVNIKPLKTKIRFKINGENIEAGSYVRITGNFTDEKGNPLKNTLLKDKINNFTVHTNKKGEFNKKIFLNTPGLNTFKLQFDGNEKYYPSSSNITFTAGKFKTSITLETIGSVKKGHAFTIAGKIHYYTIDDTDYKYTDNQTVNIKINGKTNIQTVTHGNLFEATVKADKIDKLGINLVSVTYNGNEYTLSSSENDTFYVYNQTESLITIPFKNQDISKDYEIFSEATYELDNGKVVSYIYNVGYNYGSPVNKIIKGTFYLKNSKGNIITKTVTARDDHFIEVQHDEEYTPYKVDLTLKEITNY